MERGRERMREREKERRRGRRRLTCRCVLCVSESESIKDRLVLREVQRAREYLSKSAEKEKQWRAC